MKNIFLFLFVCINTIFAFDKVSFEISIDKSILVEQKVFSGRLLIFITNDLTPVEKIRPNFFDLEAVYVSGMDVSNLQHDKPFTMTTETPSFPNKLSTLSDGKYQIMALLDQNFSYTYYNIDGGDLYSDVVTVEIPATKISLVLSNIEPDKQVDIPDNVKVVNFKSDMLSNFWGREIYMQASVLLPPSYENGDDTFPVVYDVHGFGGDHLHTLRRTPALLQQMKSGNRPEMIYVYLNANCSLGHHVFADSVNTGPWGNALTKELVPHLEKEFKMDGKPTSRFLTGHSSGGWSTLWLMVNYPDFFGGVWSTAPDPVDFRNFTGPNLTNYPPQNLYYNEKGEAYNLVRYRGQEIMSLEEYAKQENVFGRFGGQFASFDAVFSPRGLDGQPMPLFLRETGIIDPVVQKAWEKYDISLILRKNWKTLSPKLAKKIHIIVGTADTFHLDESVRLLDKELKKLGSDAVIEYVEGRDHFDLYRGGLAERIANEMYKIARPEKD